jgi:hypothetical protein
MINFNDLPGDIKSKIFKINKDREREEHWMLLMNQVRADAVERPWKYCEYEKQIFDRDEPIFLIKKERSLVYDGCEYRTHWDWEGNVEIWWVEDEAWRC